MLPIPTQGGQAWKLSFRLQAVLDNLSLWGICLVKNSNKEIVTTDACSEVIHAKDKRSTEAQV